MKSYQRLGLFLSLLIVIVWGIHPPETFPGTGLFVIGLLISASMFYYTKPVPSRHSCGICGVPLKRYQVICEYCGHDNKSRICPKCHRSIWDHGIRDMEGINCDYFERIAKRHTSKART